MTQEQFVSRVNARGGEKLNAFNGAVNDLIALQEGDIFTFPNPMVAYAEPIAGAARKAEFCLVTLESGDVAPFYPSALTKSRTEVDESGNSLGRVSASGSLVAAYKQFGTVNDAMQSLAGKTAILTSYRQHMVRPIGNQKPIEGKPYVETGIGQWDLVETK